MLPDLSLGSHRGHSQTVPDNVGAAAQQPCGFLVAFHFVGVIPRRRVATLAETATVLPNSELGNLVAG